MCREEAAKLTSLEPKFSERNFSLYAVVHEDLGVEEFRSFFKGEIFLDKEKRFYGPSERRMGLIKGLFSPSVWSSAIRAYRKGFSGNFKGEGRILGGLYVIGAGNKGIIFNHQETYFGDHASEDAILNAISQ